MGESRNAYSLIILIAPRYDDKELTTKVKLVNERLDKLFTQENWGLISHKNVKNIHLNKQGSAILARNIKSYLLFDFN